MVDDTGFPKKGHESVGLARPSWGQVGKQDHCRVAASVVGDHGKDEDVSGVPPMPAAILDRRAQTAEAPANCSAMRRTNGSRSNS